MILTRKHLLVDIFLTRSSSKSLAFCEFASINFEPWNVVKVSKSIKKKALLAGTDPNLSLLNHHSFSWS